MLLVFKIQGESIWLDADGFCHVVKFSVGEEIFRSTMVHITFLNCEEEMSSEPNSSLLGNFKTYNHLKRGKTKHLL